MAGKPIKIEFTSETDKYEKGLRDAERATDKFADSIDDVPKATKKMARDIDHDMGKVEDSMGEAGKESAAEFKQNLGESLSSGDMSTIFQDTLGGLVSSLSGPLAGAAAGLAAVAVLGFGALQKQAEAAAQLSQTFLDQMRDNLGRSAAEMDAAFRAQQFQEWVKENLDLFTDVNDELHDAGINVNEYTSALYEGGQPLEDMKGKLEGILAIHGHMEGPIGRQHVVYDQMGDAAAELLTTIENMDTAHSDAAETARVYGEIVSGFNMDRLKADWQYVKEQAATPITVEVRTKMVSAYGTTNPYGNVGGTGVYKPLPAGGSG